MEKINEVILNGRIYVSDPNIVLCNNCALYNYCNDMNERVRWRLCNALGMEGFRYSQELTDKLNKI